jgi:thioredoxin-related protein
MKYLLALASSALVLSASAFAAADYETDLNKALDAAHSQNKMMFVIYGREACGNCQATKAMIKSRQIKVSESKFVLVDLNCDDKQVSAEFNRRYSKESFGTTLPFVVVADAAGNALASSGGYKNADEWEKILRAAQKKATAPGTAAGAAKSDWPFKNPAPGTSAPR